MATATVKPRIAPRMDDDEEQQHDRLVRLFVDDCEHNDGGVVARREVSRRPVSRLAVEGSGAGGTVIGSAAKQDAADSVHGRRRSDVAGARTALLPPPHAWLAIEDHRKTTVHHDDSSDDHHHNDVEQWTRLLRGSGRQQHQHRRSSFSVVRRERAAREAWLDRAWEMKRTWHQRNGGAPDADTPVVVVVGKADDAAGASSMAVSSPASHQHGVAMDVDEVRACRDLGLELPSDCTVEIQCYGLSTGASSPTHAGGADGSPCAGVASSLGADPMDVKARLKVWAQAVALTSTTQLGS